MVALYLRSFALESPFSSFPQKLNWLDEAATDALRGVGFRHAITNRPVTPFSRGKMEAERLCRNA
jgi:hypothetical protein